MPKKSAAILMYRLRQEKPEFLLVHPGGPYWGKKDEWTIPKGEFTDEEAPLEAAKREFFEETGFQAHGKFIPLQVIKQAGGKLVHVFAIEGDLDADQIQSNSFEMEWPPKSGKQQSFPEVDRACWFSAEEAKRKILKSQYAPIEELIYLLHDKQ